VVLEGLERTDVGDPYEVARVWPVGQDARAIVRAADVAIYQLGNNIEFHGDIYRLSVWEPGVVVLHDLALDGLMYGLGTMGDPLTQPARREALAAARPDADRHDPLGVPWCAQAVRRARVVVVHSRFARDYLLAFGCRTPVIVSPHPLVEDDEQIATARERGSVLRREAAREAQLIVGVAGDLNASKGIEELLTAGRHLDRDIRFVFCGRKSPHWDLAGVLRASGIRDRVTVINDATDAEFLAWLCAFDILVNVRHPHRGETSGSLVRALHAGVPSIVSGVGTYLELPDDVVERIAPGPPDPEELAAVIQRLAEDPERRLEMGRQARRFARGALAPSRTAAAYRDAIDTVQTLRSDPGRGALARWAEALDGVGVVPQMVVNRFGLRYAEAMAELRARA
jgi:glycosyltransferase involved in cell wall biosynthesis